ncbi:MAG: hypothetical protein J5699_00340 [Bacteroidales bacterium]|nr:hypothetical protein [Bacteroidales bacterium]
MPDLKHDEESRAGLYTTLIFHLSVLIILLLVSISSAVDQEHSFVLDFTKQEEREKEIRQIEMKEEAKRQIEELLGKPAPAIRNVAVDAGERLKDSKGKTGSDVYKEARDLQRKLDASRRDALREKSEAEAVDMGKGDEDSEEKETPAYRGPSVLTYSLEGRKARHLPVPAYKGYGGGDVYVAIVVNPMGRVIAAKVNEALSTPDGQLWGYALDAAKRSRFSADESAPARQEGEIVYRFIRQN